MSKFDAGVTSLGIPLALFPDCEITASSCHVTVITGHCCMRCKTACGSMLSFCLNIHCQTWEIGSGCSFMAVSKAHQGMLCSSFERKQTIRPLGWPQDFGGGIGRLDCRLGR